MVVHVAFVVNGHAQVLICVGVFQWLVSYCYFCVLGFFVEDHRLAFFLSELDVLPVGQVICGIEHSLEFFFVVVD